MLSQVLGVCFGHQLLAVLHGGSLARLSTVRRGTASVKPIANDVVSAGTFVEAHHDYVSIAPPQWDVRRLHRVLCVVRFVLFVLRVHERVCSVCVECACACACVCACVCDARPLTTIPPPHTHTHTTPHHTTHTYHYRQVLATSTHDGRTLVEVMKHQTRPVYGVQFHPELSGPDGDRVLRNFLAVCGVKK
jgi:GMP synthase-like glutamine amidotransferase